MALLHRFSKLNDRSNTGIFTFIVTRSVTRDLHRDATTKDFYYAHHRWAISFARTADKILGVYLIHRDTSANAYTTVDFTFTLLNREHFSRNEQYAEKQCKFSSDCPAHGINKWIPLNDIQSRNFGDETGEFILELSLSNLMTTSYFHFGSFEWNISIVINNGSGGSGPASLVRGLFKDSSHHHHHHQQQEQDLYGTKSNRSYLVYLNRLTGFENACRIQYRLVLGQDQLREDSGTIEQISDMNGRSRGYQIDHHTFTQLAVMGIVNLYFEFYSCNTISEAKVPITSSISPTINCYDRNKQGWSVESDIESDNLKLKLYFMDMHSVPRNHLRYVSWFVYVIVQDPHTGQQDNVAVKNAPHYNYYIQDGIDMGVVMETDISVADIKSVPKKYLENETNLTIHVEWLDSIMLFNHIYNKYDDIERIHCHQMSSASERELLFRETNVRLSKIDFDRKQSNVDAGFGHRSFDGTFKYFITFKINQSPTTSAIVFFGSAEFA
ncbi:hypothetical protein QR98_0084520 [Sarcoptes scabiei]|uniref:MATH domain-containing protein n=1 Tax=Sarcoptes scabiei TaxID=52283 RepID=A0A132AFX6_SARSC|nr:hypothetical protein QR98_0084520 [Sarcoptes scabiei]